MPSEAGIADCRVSECDRKTVPRCGTRNRKCSTAGRMWSVCNVGPQVCSVEQTEGGHGSHRVDVCESRPRANLACPSVTSPKTAPSRGGTGAPTHYTVSTRVHTPRGTSIGSAVLARLLRNRETHADSQTHMRTCLFANGRQQTERADT